MKFPQDPLWPGTWRGSLAWVGGSRRRFYDKDVLRLGTWLVGGRRWTVTPATLRRIVINFQRARSRGIRIPVVWNHSRDARDKLGEIVRLYVSGPTLRARFWAAGEGNVVRLENAASEVSVEVAEGWLDGRGRRYDLFLTHLAIVNHPVVSRQGPLVRLSLSQWKHELEPSKGAVCMTQAVSGETQVDLDLAEPSEIVEAINQIVSALGISWTLAKDTTLATLAQRLRELRDQVDALVGADLDPSVVAASLEDSTAEELRERLAQTSRQLALERRRSQEERATQFEAAVHRLIGEGKLAVADKPALLETGRSVNYALSLLAPFERIARGAVVPIQSQSRRFATAKPQVLGRAPFDDERAREIAKDYKR